MLWIKSLTKAYQAKVFGRLTRIENGNLGHSKTIQKGLYELKLDFGLGYRIYYAIKKSKVIVLLVGGDKSTQDKDIAKSMEYLKEIN